MKLKIFAAAGSALWPAIVQADPSSGWSGGYGQMMGGGYGNMMGGGWGYGVFGSLMMLVFWGVIIALIVLAVRYLTDARGSGPAPGDAADQALDLLRKRFAAGEIDEDEFNRRKRLLEG